MRQTKLDKLLDAHQSNAFPAMIEDLADHLGVTADSLRRLGVGYAPWVPFKKAPSYAGWWVFAERDADAKIVGLSLRSQDDAKFMYPGSNHGLIYEVNENHTQGSRGYSPGPHNWIRTADAGLLCPICQKPDGCLLSSESPADPAAVVCIRESVGSVRPLRFGHLHLRKPDATQRGASALPDSEAPVIVVEGMSDAAAAMDLGFIAVGRPSNLACMDVLRDLLRGREVLIIGENDRKPNGKEPGREGMLASFQTLKHVCKNPRMLMPPEQFKDLRAWKVKGGLSKDELLDYAAKHTIAVNEFPIIENFLPDTIAGAFLDANFKLASHYTLRRWEEDWYRFEGSRYRKAKDEELFPGLHDWARGKKVATDNDKKPLAPLRVKLADISENLIARVLVSDDRMPCWVNGASGPDPRDLIVFANGVLNVPAYFAGDAEAFTDPTPDLFTVAALPTVFDPTAACPEWHAFLGASLGDGDGPQRVTLLQEWMGYLLTPDTSFQKMMYFRGPTAAGKSRILDVIGEMLGTPQVAAPVFADLKDFGLNALIGKLAVLIGDARTPQHSKDQTGLETLLRITGNDALMINRKNRSHLEAVHLTARITMASNGFLDVSDHYGAMLRRLLIVQFNRSFKGCEDYGLPAKLSSEIQGITNWALEGLKRLRAQGHFTIPPSMIVAMDEWRKGASPLASFLAECCDETPAGSAGKRELFDCWIAWATEHHVFPPTFQKFLEWLRANTAAVTVHGETFQGIELKPWARKKYLGG